MTLVARNEIAIPGEDNSDAERQNETRWSGKHSTEEAIRRDEQGRNSAAIDQSIDRFEDFGIESLTWLRLWASGRTPTWPMLESVNQGTVFVRIWITTVPRSL